MGRTARTVRPDTSIRTIRERDSLVLANLGLCHTVARDLYRTSPLCRRLGEVDDLVSVAHVALVRAAERWRETGVAKFSTFAYRSISLYILRQARDAGVIHVPHDVSYAIERGQPLPEAHRTAALAAWSCLSLERVRRLSWEREPISSAEEALPEALEQLEPAERQLLAERFGLGGTPIRLYTEIAEDEGVTKTAIGHRVNKALTKLRLRLEAALAA